MANPKPLNILILLFLSFLSTPSFGQNSHLPFDKIFSDSLYSITLRETRQITVHIPESYRSDTTLTYPVAIVLDGDVFLPTVIEVQKYYSGGFTPEMILIGIDNSAHRVRDLTISALPAESGFYFSESGGAEKFRTFIRDELIPYISKTYPTTSYRTLIGHSYGGLFTVDCLLKEPQLFQNYLAADPSLDWDHQLLLTSTTTKDQLKELHGRSLFLSMSGQLHMQDARITLENVQNDTSLYTQFPRSILAFIELAKSSPNLQFDWKYYPMDIHGTVPLPSFMDGLIALFEWYQMESTDKINSFETSVKELEAIMDQREKKLATHFGYGVPPYPEELLNMSGYMFMDMDQMDKARMYLIRAIRYYPNSPNAYDSMADWFLRNGRTDLAILELEKAIALSSNVYFRDRLAEVKAMQR